MPQNEGENVHVAEPKPEDPDVEVEVQDNTQQLLGEQNGRYM